MQKNWRNNLPAQLTIAVVGLGKIGLPLAVQYAQHGHRVIGCDINAQVVECINAGKSHVGEEPELAIEVPRLVREGLLSATLDTTDAVGSANAVVVIVPVFVDNNHNVDFTSIDAATQAIGAGLKSGTLVSYETTLPVGTTSGRFRQLLENASGLKAGDDFYLAYSPERVSSGSIFRDLRTYPKVVGGIDEQSTLAGVQFYQSVLDAEIITMASANEAEFVKLIETTYRDVNIALANEFAQFADARGLNVAAAIAAANTQPYSHIHSPGVGVGGHCIPVYPYFLLAGLEEMHSVPIQPLRMGERMHFGRMQGYESAYKSKVPMLTLPRYARQINDSMAEYAVQRLQTAIGSLANQPVLILGIAYRGNVREVAFTSAKLLQQALLACGASVYVDDPLFSEDELRTLGYRPLTAEVESQIRAIILQADHQTYQVFDFSRFGSCQVVLDGRRALNKEKIESLGIRYAVIGDGR
jgi:UDP-N-acetyl-D-mannosaminuronate dehydrogenase